MSYPSAVRPLLPVWARLGAFFSFLAVLAALLAPLSLLAEEVRTGKLGGICSAGLVSTGNSANSDNGAGQALPAASHCDWCSSVALALPPLAHSSIPCFAGFEVADLAFPTDRAAGVTGLPFSRAPPAVR